MNKRYYRFFGGFLTAQENWLNRMAKRGCRLVATGRQSYDFEACQPGEVGYCVDFIGDKSGETAKEYRDFLEDMGYRVFFKNMNLNYSVGKVRLRPWAQRGGRIATNATTFNRELLIVEKDNDGKPFALHTSYEDRAGYYRRLRNPWLTLALVLGALGVWGTSMALLLLALAALIPVFLYQWQVIKMKWEAKTKEW